MICAYDKLYLDKARVALARMFDFAVHDLKYDLEKFFHLFAESEVAKRFEKGESAIVVGRSGIELAYIVTEGTKEYTIEITPRYEYNRSREYWLGWALAYYQWSMNASFSDIEDYLNIKELLELYHPYHEMDIRQFVDRVNAMYKEAKKDTNLKLRRQEMKMTQKELAEQTGIPVRTIQQYEQRKKNINKAAAESLIALAEILLCEPKDLCEMVE